MTLNFLIFLRSTATSALLILSSRGRNKGERALANVVDLVARGVLSQRLRRVETEGESVWMGGWLGGAGATEPGAGGVPGVEGLPLVEHDGHGWRGFFNENTRTGPLQRSSKSEPAIEAASRVDPDH